MDLVPALDRIRIQALDSDEDFEFEGLEAVEPRSNDVRIHGEFTELPDFNRKRDPEARGDAQLQILLQRPAHRFSRRDCRHLRIHFSCPAPARGTGTVQDVVEVMLGLGRPVSLRDVIVAGLLHRANDSTLAKERRDTAAHLALWILGKVLSFEDTEQLLERVLFGYRPARGASKSSRVAALTIDEGPRNRARQFTRIRLTCRDEVAQGAGPGCEREVNQALAAWILRPGYAGNPVLMQAMWGEDTPVWIEFPLPHRSELRRVSLSDMLDNWLRPRRLKSGLTTSHTAAVTWLQGELRGRPASKPAVRVPANPTRRCPTCRQFVRLRMASVFGHDVLELGPHPALGPARLPLCMQVEEIVADYDPVPPWPPTQNRPLPVAGRAALRHALAAQAHQNVVRDSGGHDAP